MHGYKPEELLGKNHLLLIHPDDRDSVSKVALKRIRGGVVPERYEIRRIRKDDKTNWCEMMATNVQYRGRPAIMGNIIEITERRLSEEAKKTSEEQLRNLTAYLQKMAEIQRTNIAREIHDELGQALTILKMDISCQNIRRRQYN